ncbi:hypothetical protein CONLIGDRAFT_679729 [Coniochaeta ligniaria NRRL 30616]|uniref:Helicase C-terminal domain-containing protein n=1 Tax=Coniochaeta ligniaria NRRL 30616 TaxID=1408157 RepID=A0A1J7JNS1_9PEZI|nr:hypothetical protein CONLIGDRAFT_679729 [Coniochaeta ligniaria NRRL 30616]
MAPRVKAALTKLRAIRHLYPDEKVIVASTFLMWLDVLREAIRREEGFSFGVAGYNGTITSSTQREKILGSFNARGTGPTVLLLTAAAGGTGLNVAGASHLIICEPLWSAGKDEQLIGRISPRRPFSSRDRQSQNFNEHRSILMNKINGCPSYEE